MRRGAYLRMVKQQIRADAAVFGNAGDGGGVDMPVTGRSRRSGSGRDVSALVPGFLGHLYHADVLATIRQHGTQVNANEGKYTQMHANAARLH